MGKPDYVITHMEPTGETKRSRKPVEKFDGRGKDSRQREYIRAHSKRAQRADIATRGKGRKARVSVGVSELIALVIAERAGTVSCRISTKYTPMCAAPVWVITHLEATVSMACHPLVVTFHAKF